MVCASAGVLLMFGYDLLRAIRRAFPHKNLLTALEDFLYWSLAGVFAFGVVFVENSGAIRGFALCAMALGMGSYLGAASPYVLRAASFILKIIKIILSKIAGIVCGPVGFFVNKAKKPLKNMVKEVKMALCKNRGSN